MLRYIQVLGTSTNVQKGAGQASYQGRVRPSGSPRPPKTVKSFDIWVYTLRKRQEDVNERDVMGVQATFIHQLAV